MLKKTIIASAIFIASVTSAHASFIPFTLSLNYNGGLTSSQLNIFESARLFWESQILGYDGAINFTPGLTVNTSAVSIDGVGGVLGSAGPTAGFYNNGKGLNGILYATQGVMQFDTADLNWLEQDGRLFDVVVHELAHVIGFGTIWTHNNLYVNGSGQYTGAYATQMYQQEFGATTNYVPVELNIGPGSDNGHWAENWLGGSNELMTSYLGATPFISQTTLASFRDLGYVMAYTFNTPPDTTLPPQDVPTPFLGFIGLGALLWSSRKKK